MKIAIVHDFLNQYGGAERVVGFFTGIFNEAPLYTSIFFPHSTFDFFSGKDIKTSFLQNIPGINRHYRKYFFLYPAAFRRFDLEDYDMIITSSSSFSNFIRKRPGTVLVSYCYTPARFLWDSARYLDREHIPAAVRGLMRPVIGAMRKMDIKASREVDCFITISEYIKAKIKKIYNRESVVIYPPVEIKKYKYNEDKDDFYLVVSRLKGYKRVDVAVNAFNRLAKKLVIVGSGEDEAHLKKISGPNIVFKGRVEDSELLDLYGKARALVFTGEEDFGLTPIEAQASGTPVIAFRGGGALETIVEGETGFFYNDAEPGSLMGAIGLFEKNDIDPKKCRSNSLRFDITIFTEKIKDFIGKAYEEGPSGEKQHNK